MSCPLSTNKSEVLSVKGGLLPKGARTDIQATTGDDEVATSLAFSCFIFRETVPARTIRSHSLGVPKSRTFCTIYVGFEGRELLGESATRGTIIYPTVLSIHGV